MTAHAGDSFAPADGSAGGASWPRGAIREVKTPVKTKPGPRTEVEQAKAELLLADIEDAKTSPTRLASDWARKNPVVALVGAGVVGLVLSRSRLARRALMAAVVAPGVRRAVMHKAAEVVRTVAERRH